MIVVTIPKNIQGLRGESRSNIDQPHSSDNVNENDELQNKITYVLFMGFRIRKLAK